jgi:lipopolysaccharide export system protein LptC
VVQTSTTAHVYWARRVLPLLALLVVIALVVWPLLQKKTTAVLEQVPQNKVAPNQPEPALTVIKPEFKGVDNQQRPYHIVAEKIQQGIDTTQPVTLEHPKANLQLSADTYLNLTANNAIFDRTKNTLQLDGQVTLINQDGYTLTTQNMAIDLTTNHAQTPQAVQLIGPQVNLTGMGLELTQDAQLLKVQGPAKLVLTPLEKTP